MKRSSEISNWQQDQTEGDYLAALRGSNSTQWHMSSNNKSAKWAKTAAEIVPTFGSSTFNSSAAPLATGKCYKCGMEGHWARDCPSANTNPSAYANPPSDAPMKPCPCGAGLCLVLTAKTEKNAGRQFYRCPLPKEQGQCQFFEWCDAPTSPIKLPGTQSTYNRNLGTAGSIAPSEPELQCHCGAGPCVVLTAGTPKNSGRRFYKCPKSQQEGSCGFFKWCDEANIGMQSGPKVDGKMHAGGNYSSPPPSAAKCYKCGGEGHWSKDCTFKGPGASLSFGAASAGSGSECFKCKQKGHWSKDCPNAPQSYGPPTSSQFLAVQDANKTIRGISGGVSSESCFKCGNPGHWANNCPGA